MLRVLVVFLITSLPLTVRAEMDPGHPVAPVPPADPMPPAPSPPPTPNRYPMGWRFMLSDLTILRLNPIGLETRARLGVQKKLYESTSKVTENNFLFLGSFPKLNPASVQFSLGGELQPASIFNVRTYFELQQFFGTFGFLQSFGSANANFSDSTLSALADNAATKPESKLLRHFSVQPQVMLKLGSVVVRSLLQLDHWDFDLRGGKLVYEPTFDTLLPAQGWTMSTDTDVLYSPGNGLNAGLRHTFVKPFYAGKHFNDESDQRAYDGQNAHHRLGFFGAYTLKDQGPSTFNKPTVLLIVSFYLRHKYRAGEPDMLDPGHTSDDYRTRAFPYILAGFAFESDLLAIRER